MAMTDRRTFIQAAAALPMTATAGTAFAQAPSATPAVQAKPAPAKDVTRELAHYIVTATYDDLPANVRKEGVRTLLNWVGVAIGGSHHQTGDTRVAAAVPIPRRCVSPWPRSRRSPGRRRPRCSVDANGSIS